MHARKVGLRAALLAAVLLGIAAAPCRAGAVADVATLEAQAKAGDAEAQFRLGTLFAAGFGVEQDYLAARRWLERAAARGHGDAQCELGLLFQTSTYADTPPQDLPDAVRWYARAADQANGCGQFALAALLESGQGVAHDAAKARALYAQAAAHGYVADKASFPLQQVFLHFRRLAARWAGSDGQP